MCVLIVLTLPGQSSMQTCGLVLVFEKPFSGAFNYLAAALFPADQSSKFRPNNILAYMRQTRTPRDFSNLLLPFKKSRRNLTLRFTQRNRVHFRALLIISESKFASQFDSKTGFIQQNASQKLLGIFNTAHVIELSLELFFVKTGLIALKLIVSF